MPGAGLGTTACQPSSAWWPTLSQESVGAAGALHAVGVDGSPRWPYARHGECCCRHETGCSQLACCCRDCRIATGRKTQALLHMCVARLKQAAQPGAAGSLPLHSLPQTPVPKPTHLESKSGVLLLQAPLKGPPAGRVVEGDGAPLGAVQPDVPVIACSGAPNLSRRLHTCPNHALPGVHSSQLFGSVFRGFALVLTSSWRASPRRAASAPIYRAVLAAGPTIPVQRCMHTDQINQWYGPLHPAAHQASWHRPWTSPGKGLGFKAEAACHARWTRKSLPSHWVASSGNPRSAHRPCDSSRAAASSSCLRSSSLRACCSSCSLHQQGKELGFQG